MPIFWKKPIGRWRWCIISRSTFLTFARAHPLHTRLSFFQFIMDFLISLKTKKLLVITKKSVFAFRPNSRHILDYDSSYVNILTKLLRAGTELLYIILGPMIPINHFNHASDTRIPIHSNENNFTNMTQHMAISYKKHRWYCTTSLRGREGKRMGCFRKMLILTRTTYITYYNQVNTDVKQACELPHK